MKASPKRHLPSLVTALNLFAGFLSVISSIRGDYMEAASLIVVAAIMDVLDGKVARLTKSSSEFGVELDSLADVSSFGFAPAVLIYKAYFEPWGIWGILISFMPLVFGGIRLARFNVGVADHSEKDSFFTGLPIPSSAITIASFVAFEIDVFQACNHIIVMAAITLLVSFLMVSKIRYEGMPNFSFQKTEDRIKLGLLIVCFIAFLIYPQRVAFPVMMLFIAYGILMGFVAIFSNKEPDEDTQDIPAID
ncbi:CDP-diacylglycerol--serine O-phosphatidyltransferase [bacterium]|nr:CDP-diacylglycerol--serine O-phosphatidyltransferase [bacterium]NUN46206.1 CDP-diacylglycerol--serine O-phosphatidyltransferase [bacterium]